jgi:hypothetical protein
VRNHSVSRAIAPQRSPSGMSRGKRGLRSSGGSPAENRMQDGCRANSFNLHVAHDGMTPFIGSPMSKPFPGALNEPLPQSIGG